MSGVSSTVKVIGQVIVCIGLVMAAQYGQSAHAQDTQEVGNEPPSTSTAPATYSYPTAFTWIGLPIAVVGGAGIIVFSQLDGGTAEDLMWASLGTLCLGLGYIVIDFWLWVETNKSRRRRRARQRRSALSPALLRF